MLYKVRNRSGAVIKETRSIKNVANLRHITVDEVNRAIRRKSIIQKTFTIEATEVTKVTDTLEQTTAEMVDHGYGVDYGRYQFDKARGVIK